MPLGTEVGLGPGDVGLDGEPAPPKVGTGPQFSAHVYWAENWGLCPFGGGGAGSPSNTVWPGPRPTSVLSCILIYPAVWPQQT